MRIRVKPYHPASRGARVLARSLGALRLREPTRFRPRRNDVIINWGCTSWDRFPEGNYKLLNLPCSVQTASDKIAALQRFRDCGVPCPEFATDRYEAEEWYDEGSTVLARHLSRGCSGRGIVVCDPDASLRGGLPNAPLYTKYVKKRDEYRVFVVGGEAVRVTQKRGRTGTESDFRIRSANNGWVFCQENVDCPPAVRLAGVQAVQVLGLDFGAADVGFNEHYDMPCVYEVNTAFGMEGTTLQVVSDAIKEMYR